MGIICPLFRGGCHQKSLSRGYTFTNPCWNEFSLGQAFPSANGIFYFTPRRNPFGYIPHAMGNQYWLLGNYFTHDQMKYDIEHIPGIVLYNPYVLVPSPTQYKRKLCTGIYDTTKISGDHIVRSINMCVLM